MSKILLLFLFMTLLVVTVPGSQFTHTFPEYPLGGEDGIQGLYGEYTSGINTIMDTILGVIYTPGDFESGNFGTNTGTFTCVNSNIKMSGTYEASGTELILTDIIHPNNFTYCQYCTCTLNFNPVLPAYTIHRGSTTGLPSPAYGIQKIGGGYLWGNVVYYFNEEIPPDFNFTATINPYWYNYNSTAQLIATGGEDLTLDPAHVEVCSEERLECVINKDMAWTCLADTCFINAEFFINAYGNWTVEAWVDYEETEYYATDLVNVMIEYDYPLPDQVDFLPDHIPGYNSSFNATYYINTYINNSIFDNEWIIGYFGIFDTVMDPLEDAFGFLFGIITTPLNWITSAVDTAFIVIADTMTYFMDVSTPILYMMYQITSHLPTSFVGVVSFVLAIDIVVIFLRGV